MSIVHNTILIYSSVVRICFSPELSQTSKDTVEGLHMFAAKYSLADCSSMLAYIAQRSDVGSVKQLCFQVSVPGYV